MIKRKKGPDIGIHRLGSEEMIKVTDRQGMVILNCHPHP